jgi:hypothetical protein
MRKTMMMKKTAEMRICMDGVSHARAQEGKPREELICDQLFPSNSRFTPRLVFLWYDIDILSGFREKGASISPDPRGAYLPVPRFHEYVERVC